jgi:rhamnose utilization protein RhaD (predicted bifunctional aldolase and dehydrogenase)
MPVTPRQQELIDLSRFLGDPTLDLAILGEGNGSCREDADTFWVKASGFNLRDMDADGLTLVRFEPMLEATRSGVTLSDQEVAALLLSSRAGEGKKPSVETFLHSSLLSIPGIDFVGHTHPTPVLSLVCSPKAPELAEMRLCPDDIVCCGPATAWVPYVDPGLTLARETLAVCERFADKHGMPPRVIWMENHGLIALGSTVKEVQSATLMAVKMARAILGNLAAGIGLKPMTDQALDRITNRPDEKERQQILK